MDAMLTTTETTTIEELLATPAPFHEWLEHIRRGFGPDYRIGEACASFGCPLNQFLADELGRDRYTIEVEIAPPVVRLWRLDETREEAFEDGPEIPLPAWAGSFASQVDRYPAGRRVRVDEALFLIEYIEGQMAAMAAAEGVLP